MSTNSVPEVSAVAPRNVRIVAFCAICAGGLLGGLIGWSFVRIQVRGNADNWAALGAFGGAVLAALGIAIVATLVLRAMREWKTIQRGVNPRTGQAFTPQK